MGILPQPGQPGTLNVTLGNARLISIHRIHPHGDWRFLAGQEQAGEIAAQPQDAIDTPLRQSLLSFLDAAEIPRPEKIRMIKGSAEAGGIAVRAVDDEAQGNVPGIQGHPIAEQEQQHHGHKKGDGDTGRVAQNLQPFLADHALEAHAGLAVHAAFSRDWIRPMKASSMLGRGLSGVRASIRISWGVPSASTAPSAMITRRSQ